MVWFDPFFPCFYLLSVTGIVVNWHSISLRKRGLILGSSWGSYLGVLFCDVLEASLTLASGCIRQGFGWHLFKAVAFPTNYRCTTNGNQVFSMYDSCQWPGSHTRGSNICSAQWANDFEWRIVIGRNLDCKVARKRNGLWSTKEEGKKPFIIHG